MGSIAYSSTSTDLTAIYNACVAKGITPASKSVADIANAVSRIPGDTKHTLTVRTNSLGGWCNVQVLEGSSVLLDSVNNKHSGFYINGYLTI